MFKGCVELKSMPKLPALNVSENSYSYMFQDCTSLYNVENLPATTIEKSAYYYMFNGCTALEDVSKININVETLPDKSCQGMFYSCTSLLNSPQITAIKLNVSSCANMFQNCTNLISAPILSSIREIRFKRVQCNVCLL